MKRVADKQLIKDGREEDEDDDVGMGFRKADESTLARRQIKALPKRSLAGAPGAGSPAPSPAGLWGGAAPAAVASETEAAPMSKFAGFSGFGASSTTAASSFGVGAPSTNTSTSSGSPFGSSFGSSFGSTTLTTTAGASSSAKMFASFLGGGATATNGVDSKPASTPVTEPLLPAISVPATSTSGGDKQALHYYTSLRGLNVSLVDAINKYIEEDSFVDLSVLLEQYKSKRAEVQKEFDSKKAGPTKTNGAPAAPAQLTPPPASRSSFAPPPPSSSSTDIKAPSPGSGFSFTPKPAPLSSKPLSFTPPPPTGSKSSDSKPAPEGFSFGGPPSTTAAPSTLGGFPFGGASTAASSSGGSSFGAPAKDSTPSSTPSPSGFSFSAPAKDTASSPAPSGFGFGAPPKNTSSSLTGFSFGAPAKFDASSPSSLPFSLSSTPSSSAPKPFLFGSEKPKEEDKGEAKPDASAPSSGLFGAASTSSSTSSPFGVFGKPAANSGFSFGPSAPALGGESKPFSFGGGSSTPSVFGGAAGGGSGFAFGGTSSSAATKTEDEGDAMKEDAGNTASDGAPSAAAMLGVNPHDEEGEGEEDEKTVHSIKSKVYRMRKADEKGGPGWVEAGHGVLRLKKHKETSARRMLLRNSTTGKININFALYSGLSPNQSKKTVTFIGHDNGVAQMYNARVPSEEAARELKEALEREVALLKAKDS
ncbi:hypothetical protein FA13DRAFT_1761541 [Coprinellus micaceus]|uniref:RanBD1 domain-containing protein n=1 Tax=Coprinellus micaceus TaxID=71717 RepID=A0A4Y7TWV8_COPMI|nr:hypothetical protein FA13DRAFT_1761541 [Coprinellus micaceus]